MAAKMAENPRLSWDGGEIRRETDCLLEGDGFEPSVPRYGELGAPGPRATRPRAIVNGFVERLDDLALELAQPAAHTIIPSPSRVFRDAD
jgi:hypothetical protein